MSFHNIRLPKFIEIFATGRPEFTSSSVTTISGREIRSLDMEYAKQKYTIKNCKLSKLEFEQFNSFFRARRGQRFTFRFHDHADDRAEKQFIAKGEGNKSEFFLTKSYDDPISPYFRRITKPIENTVKIYIENQMVEAKIDYNQGIVNLSDNLKKGSILSADFRFDVQVRFASDSFSYLYQSDNAIGLEDIELYEVVE